MDPVAPERARMAHMGGGLVSDNRHSPPHTVAYDAFQACSAAPSMGLAHRAHRSSATEFIQRHGGTFESSSTALRERFFGCTGALARESRRPAVHI